MNSINRISAAVLASLMVTLSACGGPSDASVAPAAVKEGKAATTAGEPGVPKSGGKPGAGGKLGGGGPVTVTSVSAVARDMPVVLMASGTVVPIKSVDVRSQVTSVVTKVHIHEGQFVKAGELMFTLDARADEANAAKAAAQLAKDQAALADAQRQLARIRQLQGQNFVSQGAVDSAQALVEGLQATLAADRAAIDVVKVAVSNSRIVAPLSGRVGQVPVAPGNVVQANVTSLVTVTQLHPIAVAFNLPQRSLSDGLAALKEGGAPVSATLSDGGGTFTGRLQFIDSLVDPSSGTVKVKAAFDNKESKLWPGAFVEVAQTVRILQGAVVVPQAAIIQGDRGALVYVVEDGKASPRPVKTLYAQDGEAAVSGVKVGDAVIVDGRQNVRPGAQVQVRSTDENGAGGGRKGEGGNRPNPKANGAIPAGQ